MITTMCNTVTHSLGSFVGTLLSTPWAFLMTRAHAPEATPTLRPSSMISSRAQVPHPHRFPTSRPVRSFRRVHRKSGSGNEIASRVPILVALIH